MSGKEENQPDEEDPNVSLLKWPLRVFELPIDDWNREVEKLGGRKLMKLTDILDPVFFPKKKRRRARKKRNTKKKSSSDHNRHAKNNPKSQPQAIAVQ